MPKEFRVEVRVRNSLVLTAMEENGIATITELCRRAGIEKMNSHMGDIINLKTAPRNMRGQWRPAVLKIAKVLKRLPEDLFTPEQQGLELPRNKGAFEVSFEEVHELLEAHSGGRTPELIAERRELRLTVNKVLGALTTREERVLRMHFGLGETEEHTFEEIGKELKISRQRAQQIVEKALRKLRRPSQVRELLLAAGAGIRIHKSAWEEIDIPVLDGTLFED